MGCSVLLSEHVCWKLSPEGERSAIYSSSRGGCRPPQGLEGAWQAPMEAPGYASCKPGLQWLSDIPLSAHADGENPVQHPGGQRAQRNLLSQRDSPADWWSMSGREARRDSQIHCSSWARITLQWPHRKEINCRHSEIWRDSDDERLAELSGEGEEAPLFWVHGARAPGHAAAFFWWCWNDAGERKIIFKIIYSGSVLLVYISVIK